MYALQISKFYFILSLFLLSIFNIKSMEKETETEFNTSKIEQLFDEIRKEFTKHPLLQLKNDKELVMLRQKLQIFEEICEDLQEIQSYTFNENKFDDSCNNKNSDNESCSTPYLEDINELYDKKFSNKIISLRQSIRALLGSDNPTGPVTFRSAHVNDLKEFFQSIVSSQCKDGYILNMLKLEKMIITHSDQEKTMQKKTKLQKKLETAEHRIVECESLIQKAQETLDHKRSHIKTLQKKQFLNYQCCILGGLGIAMITALGTWIVQNWDFKSQFLH